MDGENQQGHDKQPPTRGQEPRRRAVRDLPHLIKYILLLLMLILVFTELRAGEYTRQGSFPWIVLLVKFLLIAILILLIRVQRSLTCQLTAPTGCTEEEPDPAAGRLFVRVKGSAGGAVFGHYTLAVKKVGFANPIPNVVHYPGGGASGAVPVTNGELGQIDTTSLTDDAYQVTLTVYPAGPGAPKSCTIIFDLLKSIVYMSRFAGVQAISMAPVPNNPNPFDPASELRAGGQPVAVGGTMTIDGAAYIYECEDRRIKEYQIRWAQVTSPATEPSQPPTGASIPATWPVANRAVLFEYSTPDQYQPWTRIGPAQTDLINSWNTMTIGGTTHYKLAQGAWNSAAAGSGRFSFLLTAEDTGGHRYHDIQHVWLDNHPVIGTIVKFQYEAEPGVWKDIPKCEDLSLSKHKNVRVLGLAWDYIVDAAWWPAVAPNDNFSHYNLTYWKQFGAAFPLTGNLPSRVPALPALPPVVVPTVADAGELAQWDLTTLDAGPKPTPFVPAPDPKIYRGDSCTYILQLYVTDSTVVPGAGSHQAWHQVPVKIVNDL